MQNTKQQSLQSIDVLHEALQPGARPNLLQCTIIYAALVQLTNFVKSSPDDGSIPSPQPEAAEKSPDAPSVQKALDVLIPPKVRIKKK